MRGLRTPKGTVDFHPSESKLINEIINKCESIFRIHGGRSLDTPIFELLPILQNKSEEETLLFELNDQGGDICGLRFDLTVPLARYIAQNRISSLRRYQIGKVFRRDQPAITKGRYREFYQCDFDICGKFLPLLPDAETIKIAAKILRSYDIGEFVFKINHRKLITAMCLACVETSENVKLRKGSISKDTAEYHTDAINDSPYTSHIESLNSEVERNDKIEIDRKIERDGKIQTDVEIQRDDKSQTDNKIQNHGEKEKVEDEQVHFSGKGIPPYRNDDPEPHCNYDENTDFSLFCSAIDKLEKIGIVKVKEEIVQKGWSVAQAEKMEELLKIRHLEEVERYFNTGNNVNSISQKLAKEAIDDLRLFFKYVEILGESECVQFEISLARGLNYYTGIIFEGVYKEHPDVGSVLGGGRYDNLVGQFCNNQVPAVGFSVGILRIFSILKQGGRYHKTSFTKVLVVPRNVKLMESSLVIINKLWEKNIPAEINTKKRTDIADMKKYAKKEGISFLLLIGDEIVDNKAVLYRVDEQETQLILTVEQIIEHLQN